MSGDAEQDVFDRIRAGTAEVAHEARHVHLIDANIAPYAVALAADWEAAHGTRPLMECSGGITVQTAAAYAATGVDLLSTSQITQSAPALDIGLDIGG